MTAKNLIAFYSWSGNTEALATAISHLTDSDVYEIKVPADTFSDDMYATSDIAKQQLANNQLPSLSGQVPDVSRYEHVFVGGPTWSGAPSTPVLRFLNAIKDSPVTLIPFYTHAGTAGGYEQAFAKAAAQSHVLKGFGTSGYGVGHAESQVKAWLNQIGID